MVDKNKIIAFIEENEQTLKERFRIVKIGLFGSIARGEQIETSDIDLIVEFEPGTENLHEIKNELRELFRVEFNVNVDVCREKYLKPIFRDKVLSEAKYVYQT